MDKKALRAEIREKKRAMTESQIEKTSAALGEQLRNHPLYQSAKSIFGYLSYNQEVRTMPMLEQAQKDGKRVAVPKVIDDTMIFIWLDDLSRVELGYCNIPEPVDNGPEAVDETALVMMPGLAFDPQGHRCGYGGGFYDRYLEKHPDHPTIAMCYGFQMFDRLDVDAHDIPVDVVLHQEVLG
ncbi:MAG: 5-formyltetrahydrofolate cyclo-ligase [Oscillospiraceae bacterium]|nr:5-formyltetrahydrofolate cyclo-ligase [Oscillospiraceae bacterium]